MFSPPCAVQSLVIHETTRTDKAGNTTVQRRITLRFVDKVRAMRLDDALEEKQEKAAHAEALKRIAYLEKALTEADHRELRDSRDLEEKDRQLEALQRARQLAETTASAAADPASIDPEPVEGQRQRAEQIARAEAQRRRTEEIQIQSKIREIEHCQNTSGHLGFSSRYPKWPEEVEARRAYALRLIKAEAEAAERRKIANAQRAADRELAERARRPTRSHPRNFAAQGRERIIH